MLVVSEHVQVLPSLHFGAKPHSWVCLCTHTRAHVCRHKTALGKKQCVATASENGASNCAENMRWRGAEATVLENGEFRNQKALLENKGGGGGMARVC